MSNSMSVRNPVDAHKHIIYIYQYLYTILEYNLFILNMNLESLFYILVVSAPLKVFIKSGWKGLL